ncbi:hypothetical protein [Chengkuizengella axinellae]|uniref:hypothetical protein n=1 Tax=Chengkuizengella axinellae TaxID=3064388 RepID=UPI003528B74E
MESLKKYGCERIYSEKQSGVKSDREELDYLRSGDSLVVYKMIFSRNRRISNDLHLRLRSYLKVNYILCFDFRLTFRCIQVKI